MSEGSSSSLKIRLIFKLCFQRKRSNLEITDYIKQISHIAGVNSIQGEFNLPGVFISLNIICISNESLIEHLSLNFIKKERKEIKLPAGSLVFTKYCWLRKAFYSQSTVLMAPGTCWKVFLENEYF